MERAIIATFCKDRKNAEKIIKEKNKLFPDKFTILEAKRGFYVVSKKQLD